MDPKAAGRFFTHTPEHAMTDTLTTERPEVESRLLNDIKSVLFTELTLNDRCDSCGAAAKAQFQVTAEMEVIRVCGHHWRKLRAGILQRGYLYAEPSEDPEPFTWASHEKPWPNQFRDAGSAAS